MPCAGDSEETCGGTYAMSVYEPTDYLGCFVDSAISRVFSETSISSGMTAAVSERNLRSVLVGGGGLFSGAGR